MRWQRSSTRQLTRRAPRGEGALWFTEFNGNQMDYGDNAMAKVHAAKTLETMLDATSERTGIGRMVQQQRVPGLQIVIVQGDGTKQGAFEPSAAAPLIEATPAAEAEPAIPSAAEAE
jgi:hypothetical protein